MQMPFGKHRGEELEDLPEDYIHWLVTEFDGLRPYLRQRLEEELQKREEEDRARRQQRKNQSRASTSNGGPPPHLKNWVEEIVRRGYRATSFKAHPDQGGSNEAMKELNEAKAWLEKLCS
jgi:Putative quorum-sensing-regulated virulence factor